MLTISMPEDLRAPSGNRRGDLLIGLEPPYREVVRGPRQNADGDYVVGLDDDTELAIPAGGAVAIDRDGED